MDDPNKLEMLMSSEHPAYELMAATKPIFVRAREIIENRGWGRKAYAYGGAIGLGRPVRKGPDIKATHRHFSVAGAITLACYEKQREESLTDDQIARVFQQSLDTMMSVIYLGDMLEGDLKLMTVQQRMAIASQIVAHGQALSSLCGFNDVVVRDRAHAIQMLVKAVEMTDGALQGMREGKRLQ